jgi:hypothetical protein
MKRLLLPYFLLLVFSRQVAAFTLPGQEEYAGRCIQAIINCQYTDALLLADSASAADSTDPLAPLLRLTAMGIRDVDFDTLLDSAGFLHAYVLTEERIAAYEKKENASSYSKMLSGFCKGMLSAFYLRQGYYFSAMRNGFKALSILEESHRLDSTNGDPLFLLGLYEYAKGELKRRLWWLLFWYPGSKKEGIAKLWSCSKNGHLSAGGALFALADIYARENKPEEGGPIVERLEQEFPKSRFALWAKAKHLESRRLFYEAGLCYDVLAASYAAEPAGRHNALFTRNLQAHMLLRSGQKKEAADSCRAILRETDIEREPSIYNNTKKLLHRINDDENQ